MTGDKIEKNEVGGACNTCGREVRHIRDFVRERDHLGNPGIDWEDNIKMYLQEVGCGVIYWIKLAQDRDRWRAIVNGVMNLRVP